MTEKWRLMCEATSIEYNGEVVVESNYDDFPFLMKLAF